MDRSMVLISAQFKSSVVCWGRFHFAMDGGSCGTADGMLLVGVAGFEVCEHGDYAYMYSTKLFPVLSGLS